MKHFFSKLLKTGGGPVKLNKNPSLNLNSCKFIRSTLERNFTFRTICLKYLCCVEVPAAEMGLSWEAVHEPVPMDLSASPRIVRAMVSSGPFERFVWSVVHDRRYDFRPGRARSSFDPAVPMVLVKVERQVTVPFPELRCCLFVLRQYLVEDYDRELLAVAIEGMDEEQRRYKGLSDPGPLVDWLRG